MSADDRTYELLLIAGRSGVGKSIVAFEVSRQLQARSVAHCLIDGDNLCDAHPAPADDPDRIRIARANLAAVWANYDAAGYHRLIYTNTVSVLEADSIARAIASSPRISGVLLTADDRTAERRLHGREIGGDLERHVTRSSAAARQLDETTPSWVHRLPTDDRSVIDIAHEIVAVAAWTPTPTGC